MKKALLILSAILVLSFVAEKSYTFKFTESQINYHWQQLNGIKQVVDQSSLPHNQVVYIVHTIDSLQKDLSANLKIDSTKQK